MRRIAVFDVDGTLTDTNEVDNECYLRAVGEILGLDAAELNWSRAPHVTDAALLHWLCVEYCGRALSGGEGEAVLDRFLAHLRSELAARPERFQPIAGAAQVFAQLSNKGWAIALATGGWQASARLKLAAAGIPHDPLVMASATDADTRTAIMRLAVERAAAHVGSQFERIVSVGDALWDVKAARELTWPFVGIARGERAIQLRAAGAAVVLPDLLDVTAFCRALDSAEIPGEGIGLAVL